MKCMHISCIPLNQLDLFTPNMVLRKTNCLFTCNYRSTTYSYTKKLTISWSSFIQTSNSTSPPFRHHKRVTFIPLAHLVSLVLFPQIFDISLFGIDIIQTPSSGQFRPYTRPSRPSTRRGTGVVRGHFIFCQVFVVSFTELLEACKFLAQSAPLLRDFSGRSFWLALTSLDMPLARHKKAERLHCGTGKHMSQILRDLLG